MLCYYDAKLTAGSYGGFFAPLTYKPTATYYVFKAYGELYALGNQCGGNFTYTKSGKKNCSNCLIPHSEDGYEFDLSKLVLLDEKMRCMEERNNDTVSD